MLCKYSISLLTSVTLFPSLSAIFSASSFMECDELAHGLVATPLCKIALWNSPKNQKVKAAFHDN